MKAYDFTIIANPAEKNDGQWITILPMQTIHKGLFTGTVQQLTDHLIFVKNLLIEENQFNCNEGFYLFAYLKQGQRSPANWKKTAKAISQTYFAKSLALNIAA